MTTATNRQRLNERLARAAVFGLLAIVAALCAAPEARAQWTTSGTNINNTNTGNVGVGTASPQAPLHLSKPYAPYYGQFALQDPSADGAVATIYMSFYDTNSRAGTVGFGRYGGASDPEFYITNQQTSGGFRFRNASSDLLTVANTGNVGIGITSPAQALHVKGKGLVQNTGTASAFIMDRTDGKIASMGAGGESATFAYDDTGVFKIESNTRANINTGVFGAGATTRLIIDGTGNVGVGTSAPTAKLHVTGDIRVDGNISAKYQDVAEWVPSTQQLAVGTVVVVDAAGVNHVLASKAAYDTGVAGVITGQPGLLLGDGGEGKVKVATTGRVKVKVDATRAPIRAGDLLVTSGVEGVAMRSEPVSVGGVAMHRPGTLIGKALESLDKGTGEILVLLSLQ